MLSSIVIVSLTCFFLVLCVLLKPTIRIKKIEFQTFWIACFLGAVFAVVLGILPLNQLLVKLKENNAVNPFKILTLFICLSIISITLDSLGFFKYLAVKVSNKFNKSQYALFFSMYILIAVLTIFTSNDIIILTFTPFICYFAKNSKINPLPFLVMQFIAANTYSMLLYIGNPTNIYLSQNSGVYFIEYFKVMWLPTLFAGITSLILLLCIFRKSLTKKISIIECENMKIENKALIYLSLFILIMCTVLLAISNYINIEMWLICFASALFLSVCLCFFSFVKRKNLLKDVYKKVPCSLIIFVLSMYTLVLALEYNGATFKIAEIINNITQTKLLKIFIYGISSTIFDNLINNIPMSILFSSIVHFDFSHEALYATIIGSNIGAYLTPIGALAGIMWMSILKKQGVDYSFAKFIKYGAIFVPCILGASLLGLSIVL